MKMLDKMIKDDICEIFNSWQGEGLLAGTPATFVRFNKCNLACDFCDTTKKLEEKCDSSFQDLIKLVDVTKHIVFTGGEPGLFIKDIKDIISNIPRSAISDWRDLYVTIETNGLLLTQLVNEVSTVLFYTHLDMYIRPIFSVSPKKEMFKHETDMANFSEKAFSLFFTYYNRQVQLLPWLYGVCFKIVVTKDEFPEKMIQALIYSGVPKNRIFAMVEGKTKTEISKNRKRTINLAKEYNVGICAREHIILGYP